LRKKTSRNLRGVVKISAIAVNTVVWFCPVMLFAMLKLLVPGNSFRRIMSRWIMAMGENWVSWNAVILSLRHSDRLDVRGIKGLNRQEWYLVIANHQTWVDIIALQIVLNRRIPFLKFFKTLLEVLSGKASGKEGPGPRGNPQCLQKIPNHTDYRYQFYRGNKIYSGKENQTKFPVSIPAAAAGRRHRAGTHIDGQHV
jgi:hypothetical protein